MSFKIASRVQETTTTSGTGAVTLAGAVSGYTTFTSMFSPGDRVFYCIAGGAQWEIGEGTFFTGPNRITRDSVILSSGGSGVVALDGTEKKVFSTIPAERIPFRRLAADPAALVPGDTWYNVTAGVFRGAVPGTAAWSTVASLSTARNLAAACGAWNSTLVVGGINTSVVRIGTSETFNGTAWSAGTALPSSGARDSHSLAGTSTAALLNGGYDGAVYVNTSYTWNGTAWNTSTAASTVHLSAAHGGTQTNFVVASGGTDYSIPTAVTETWNGTAWSTQAAITTARISLRGCGTPSGLMAIGGKTGSADATAVTTCHTFNGTTWAATGSLSLSRFHVGASGTTSSAVMYGGFSSAFAYLNDSALFNGSTWTASANMGTAVGTVACSGSIDTYALCIGGLISTGARTATVQKFDPGNAIAKTFTLA